MIKWIVFGVISLMWIAVCHFFGSMVGLTDAQVPASMAQRACADRLSRQAGGVGDYESFRYSKECMDQQRAVLRELAGPAQRKGLLIGFAPVILVGALMRFSGGRRG
jgi:hypothetical protein